MDCRMVDFLPKKSDQRIENAKSMFDQKALLRIFAFSLYMFGAQRKIISKLVGMPEESVKTTIRVVMRDGLQAFLDRRKTKHFSTPVIIKMTKPIITVRIEDDWIVIDFNSNIKALRIPVAHKNQIRTVLLTFLNSGLLSNRETAQILEISDSHCRMLAGKILNNDIQDSLIDKRAGQLQELRVGPIQKAELIRQFAARTVTGHSTASDVLVELINENTQTKVSSRTVRWHMNKLGLVKIKKTLPELVDTLKKSS